jgi:hypothetical protein
MVSRSARLTFAIWFSYSSRQNRARHVTTQLIRVRCEPASVLMFFICMLALVNPLDLPSDLDAIRTIALEQNLKIVALTLELAYYRSINFGKTSASFSGEQRELFNETIGTDLAAIQAELVRPDTDGGEAGRRSRWRPDSRASSIAMSQSRAMCGMRAKPGQGRRRHQRTVDVEPLRRHSTIGSQPCTI